MPLKLLYITRDPAIARAAQKAGVDRIFVDLEKEGKAERQGHVDSVKSRHEIGDVARLRPLVTTSQLLVRVNPLSPRSPEEIERVIAAGADVVMLPMFTSAAQAGDFVRLVKGRALTSLLLETREAVEALDQILRVPGIDEIHIGLNDLHLSYGQTFMFEPLANGMIDDLCARIRAAGIPYGFGGVARLGQGALPAEYILAEHRRLGSTRVILSRSFFDAEKAASPEGAEALFAQGVQALRQCEADLERQGDRFFADNHRRVVEQVAHIRREIATARQG